MPSYHVDEKVASRIELLVKKQPFENITFNEALIRLLELIPSEGPNADKILESLLESLPDKSKVKSSPRPSEWIKEVPELNMRGRFSTWKSICDFLDIDVGTDSARRKLQAWVARNKPNWPKVPEV
ncbi:MULTISPECIES: hypothetical protein [Shewanella]|uniref:Uncharacterized protein n=1 Tax=Shewanella algae TaxID=38313 RepID=A0AAD1NM26_9GAMM|nr:hypothetical protein [Shewanella algae]EKT4488332.1 hypothetical protein [Shewanella algae]MBO2546721.1 hypothetical protein [Shewanella algae]MBO2657148.1 hypothetical protein [Shewanella algae]MDL2197264.1 hypothetical protein [Shewanella algae]TVO97282.1 hypothetical protein AYI86_11940 [Shewanella algae]